MKNLLILLPILLLSLTLTSPSAAVVVLNGAPVSGEHYRNFCENTGDRDDWPCWQFVSGSLIGATFDDYAWMQENIEPQTLYIKQDYLDFTVSKSHHQFSLSWYDGNIRFYYLARQSGGCYSLKMTASANHDIKFTSDDGVVTDTRQGIVKDGIRYVETGPVCSKWGQIYLS